MDLAHLLTSVQSSCAGVRGCCCFNRCALCIELTSSCRHRWCWWAFRSLRRCRCSARYTFMFLKTCSTTTFLTTISLQVWPLSIVVGTRASAYDATAKNVADRLEIPHVPLPALRATEEHFNAPAQDIICPVSCQ